MYRTHSKDSKDSPKHQKVEDQELEERERKSTVEGFFQKSYWQPEIRIEGLRYFQIFSLKIDLNTLETTEAKTIKRLFEC